MVKIIKISKMYTYLGIFPCKSLIDKTKRMQYKCRMQIKYST